MSVAETVTYLVKKMAMNRVSYLASILVEMLVAYWVVSLVI